MQGFAADSDDSDDSDDSVEKKKKKKGKGKLTEDQKAKNKGAKLVRALAMAGVTTLRDVHSILSLHLHIVRTQFES